MQTSWKTCCNILRSTACWMRARRLLKLLLLPSAPAHVTDDNWPESGTNFSRKHPMVTRSGLRCRRIRNRDRHSATDAAHPHEVRKNTGGDQTGAADAAASLHPLADVARDSVAAGWGARASDFFFRIRGPVSTPEFGSIAVRTPSEVGGMLRCHERVPCLEIWRGIVLTKTKSRIRLFRWALKR